MIRLSIRVFTVFEVANVWKLQNSYDIYDGELIFMNKKIKISVDKGWDDGKIW